MIEIRKADIYAGPISKNIKMSVVDLASEGIVNHMRDVGLRLEGLLRNFFTFQKSET